MRAIGLQHVGDRLAAPHPVGRGSAVRADRIVSRPVVRIAASDRQPAKAVLAAKEAGFRYALAPILEPCLLRQANALVTPGPRSDDRRKDSPGPRLWMPDW